VIDDTKYYENGINACKESMGIAKKAVDLTVYHHDQKTDKFKEEIKLWEDGLEKFFMGNYP